MTLTANFYFFSDMMEAIILSEKTTYMFLNFHIRSPFHFTIIASLSHTICATPVAENMTTTAKLDEKALEENRCKYKFSIWQPMHVTRWCCWKLYPLGCVKIWERLVQQLIARNFLNTRSCVRPVAAVVGLGRAAVRGRCRI